MLNQPIYDITPFTLLDFPQKIACIIWFAGCNMRCPYCYNVDIVKDKGKKSTSEVSEFLIKRMGKLDGVVFSGGECTLHPSDLTSLCKLAKKLNYAVKIDTNGTNPKLTEQLIKEGLVDYVALDYKGTDTSMSSITKRKSAFIEFEGTFAILQKSGLPFELRTTLHSSILSSDQLIEMGDYLNRKDYKNTWYWQEFIEAPKTIGDIGASKKGFRNELTSLAQTFTQTKVELRV